VKIAFTIKFPEMLDTIQFKTFSFYALFENVRIQVAKALFLYLF
jgi:hypothetical protein